MSVVIIGPQEEQAIKALVEEARRNCIPWEVLRQHAIVGHDRPVLTLEERRKVPERPEPRHLMVGNVECAFSFEEQPAGIIRHLSVSVRDGRKLPSPAAVAMIAEAFGFSEFPPTQGNVWVEEYEKGRHAVNVVEVAEPSTASGTLQ